METPLRILRARADDLLPPAAPSKRQLATRNRILVVSETLFGEYGYENFTPRRLADSLAMQPRTLHRFDGKNHEITRGWLEWDTPILQP